MSETSMRETEPEAPSPLDPFSLMTADLLEDAPAARDTAPDTAGQEKEKSERRQKPEAQAAAETPSDGLPEAVRKYLEGQGSRVAGSDNKKPPDKNDVDPDKEKPPAKKDVPPKKDGPILPPPKPERDIPPKPEKDDPGKKVAIKDKYGTDEVKEALEVAKKNGLPVVVHVGAKWCGPCRAMEATVWPTIEKEMKGKAVFLHVDVDEAESPEAKNLASKAPGYPTIMIVQPKDGPGGSINLEVKQKRTAGMGLDEMRRFLAPIRPEN